MKMADNMLESLAWLPAPPDDFKEQLAACGQGSGRARGQKGAQAGPALLRQLAQTRLSALQLGQLARAAAVLGKKAGNGERSGNKKEAGKEAEKGDPGSLERFHPLKLGIIGNVTTDFVVPALQGSALRYGIDLDVYVAGFDQMEAECLDPGSGLRAARPDVVFFMIDMRGFSFSPCPGDVEQEKRNADQVFAHLMALREALGAEEGGGPLCLFQSLVPPDIKSFGSAEAVIPGTLTAIVGRFNDKLRAHGRQSGDAIFDCAALAAMAGFERWQDPVAWNVGKQPFAQRFIPFYSDALARLIAALAGKSRKALVMDLDNTLWGGVIGDDGLEGIEIGTGSPLGEAYLDLQRVVLTLRQRGVVLAVCSKNDDETARRPFREHPEMLLKEEHISAFQANWEDKASNIKAIADYLALGHDSLVFLDDNPAERDRVRQMLPCVAVPELPDDPAYFSRVLSVAGYFESPVFSEEDQKRADYYAGNAQRLELRETLGSYDDYLKSLEMRISFSPFDAPGRARITQLINKSNQFNLTTRRYTSQQVEAMENDSDCFTLQARLEDRFGDNGMISVVICRAQDKSVWEIDSWLMSCRVLKRGVEAAVLNEIVAQARRAGVEKIRGLYIPTAKNMLVAGHYAALGFKRAKQGKEAPVRLAAGQQKDCEKHCLWILDVTNHQPKSCPIEVKRPDERL